MDEKNGRLPAGQILKASALTLNAAKMLSEGAFNEESKENVKQKLLK